MEINKALSIAKEFQDKYGCALAGSLGRHISGINTVTSVGDVDLILDDKNLLAYQMIFDEGFTKSDQSHFMITSNYWHYRKITPEAKICLFLVPNLRTTYASGWRVQHPSDLISWGNRFKLVKMIKVAACFLGLDFVSCETYDKFSTKIRKKPGRSNMTEEQQSQLDSDQKQIKPPSEAQYTRARAHIAITYCPPIRPCKECKWPVVSGYCCQYCGSSRP